MGTNLLHLLLYQGIENTIIMQIKEISAIAGHKTDVVQTGSIYLRDAKNLLKMSFLIYIDRVSLKCYTVIVCCMHEHIDSI